VKKPPKSSVDPLGRDVAGIGRTRGTHQCRKATPTSLVGLRIVIFTTKAEYGVRLLIQLGLQGSAQPVSLKAVADAENLPLAYLERIAALLKKAGLVDATRGAHGGYVLARTPEEITMDQVVLALEGAIAPMDCFVDDRESRVLCSHLADGEHCATKLLWTRVQMGVIKSLQRTTLAELVDFASPTETTLEIHG
jgi:Rrf2 family protein